MMRRVSADNHRGQGVKNSHQQAGYMRAMISSHISDQLSCKPEWVHICRSVEDCEHYTAISSPSLFRMSPKLKDWSFLIIHKCLCFNPHQAAGPVYGAGGR